MNVTHMTMRYGGKVDTSTRKGKSLCDMVGVRLRGTCLHTFYLKIDRLVRDWK